MTIAGRKPKFADLTIVDGANYVDKKTREKLAKRPKPKKFPFKMPLGLSEDVKKCWKYLEKCLAPSGRYSEHDIDELLEMAETRARLAQLKAEVSEFGMIITVEGTETELKSGAIKRTADKRVTNPAFKELQQVQTRYRTMLYEHGMTPLGRVKLGISPDGGGPLDEIEDTDPAASYF